MSDPAPVADNWTHQPLHPAHEVRCPVCHEVVPAGPHCTHCGISLPQDQLPLPEPPKMRHLGVLKVIFIPLIVLFALLMAAMVIDAAPSITGLVLVIAAALLPAVIFAALVIRLDRYEPEPPAWMFGALLWGAVGATSLTIITSLMLRLGNDGNQRFVQSLIGAPILEESFKAVALIVLTYGFRHELDNTLDGLIYGGLIGIGFAFSENLLYFEESFKRYGMGGLGTLFVMRVLIGGWGHCVYTGMVGAAIGWSRTQYRRGFVRFVVPALVLLLAIALHTAWNWAALINAQSANSIEHAFVLQAIVAVIVILPGLLLLFLVAKESQRRQLQIVRQQLKEEVSTGHLTAAEYAVLSSDDLRGRALRHAKAVDSQLATDLKRFLNTAVELAFLKQHIEKGETLDDRRAIMLERYRRILADLRPGLLPLQRTS